VEPIYVLLGFVLHDRESVGVVGQFAEMCQRGVLPEHRIVVGHVRLRIAPPVLQLDALRSPLIEESSSHRLRGH
jgi:hypothetical protein